MTRFIAMISGLLMAWFVSIKTVVLEIVSLARNLVSETSPDERWCIDSGYSNYRQPVNEPRIRLLRWLKTASERVN